MSINQTWIQPSYPDLIEIVNRNKPFASSARSLVHLSPGAHFASIATATSASQRTFTTVQRSRDASIELCSDLVYCNHSCAPSLTFDMAASEVRVSDDKALQPGDPLTFFYPSTEWKMVQPFRCACSAEEAVYKKWITGASQMKREELAGYWLNKHIRELLDEEVVATKERL